MPLARKMNGSPRRPVVAFCLLLALLFSLPAILSPAGGWAARLAGEEEPVATSPKPTPAAKPAAVPKETPRKTKTAPAAATRAAAPLSPPAAAPVKPPAAPAGTGAAAAPAETAARQAAPGAAPPAAAQAVPAPPPPAAPVQPATSPEPTPPAPAATQASAPGAPPAASRPRFVTIDFDNVDIQVFIKFVSEITGKNFVIDDKVRGKVTLISPQKIAVEDVFKVFESVLEIYGLAAVPAGDVTKVIPALDARGKNLELRLQREEVVPEDKIVTQILSLRHAGSDEMKKVLDPLISKTSIILSYPPTGMLIITDVLSNIRRLQKIVTALDVPGVGSEVSYLPLRYASATELVRSLMTIFQQPAVKGAQATVRIVADDRTNALIVLATENDTVQIRELLKLMDREVPRGKGTIRVYYLQNANAEDLVKVLTGIQQQARAADPKRAVAAAAAAEPIFSKNVQISADKATNALIVTADPADYLVIEDVIRQLDIARSMVYLEGLIMEVQANKNFGVGVEWTALSKMNVSEVSDLGGTTIGAVGFKGSSIIPQVGAGGQISMPGGFSLGVIGAGISIAAGGTTILFPNIGAVLQAFQNDNDVRILATPQLLTLDNEEAEITVGQNVPYVTRQDMSIGATTNFSNYEYRDVGVTLRVTPHINSDGFVRLKLDQSVTKLVQQSAEVDALGNRVLTPTTLKRTAKTTVVVKSGETVVIGGMIQDDSSEGNFKVPVLGDIPVLGWLFKSRTRTNEKTNLFVFITPRVVQNPEDANKIRAEKSGYMQSLQEGSVKLRPGRKNEAPEGMNRTPEVSELPRTIETPAVPRAIETPALSRTIETPALPRTIATPAVPRTIATPAVPERPQVAKVPETPLGAPEPEDWGRVDP